MTKIFNLFLRYFGDWSLDIGDYLVIEIWLLEFNG